MRLSPYAKTILALAITLLGTAATWLQAAISDDVITSNEWAKIGIALATSLVASGGVFAVPNRGTTEQAATMSVIGPTPAQRPSDLGPGRGAV